MTSWTVIVGAAAGSYLLRVSMLTLLAGRDLHPWAGPSLTVVGPAAVGAIAAAMILVEQGEPTLGPRPELIAIGAGFVAARRSGRATDALIVGYPVLWLSTAMI